jgi:hypothetical protein
MHHISINHRTASESFICQHNHTSLVPHFRAIPSNTRLDKLWVNQRPAAAHQEHIAPITHRIPQKEVVETYHHSIATAITSIACPSRVFFSFFKNGKMEKPRNPNNPNGPAKNHRQDPFSLEYPESGQRGEADARECRSHTYPTRTVFSCTP